MSAATRAPRRRLHGQPGRQRPQQPRREQRERGDHQGRGDERDPGQHAGALLDDCGAGEQDEGGLHEQRPRPGGAAVHVAQQRDDRCADRAELHGETGEQRPEDGDCGVGQDRGVDAGRGGSGRAGDQPPQQHAGRGAGEHDEDRLAGCEPPQDPPGYAAQCDDAELVAMRAGDVGDREQDHRPGEDDDGDRGERHDPVCLLAVAVDAVEQVGQRGADADASGLVVRGRIGEPPAQRRKPLDGDRALGRVRFERLQFAWVVDAGEGVACDVQGVVLVVLLAVGGAPPVQVARVAGPDQPDDRHRPRLTGGDEQVERTVERAGLVVHPLADGEPEPLGERLAEDRLATAHQAPSGHDHHLCAQVLTERDAADLVAAGGVLTGRHREELGAEDADEPVQLDLLRGEPLELVGHGTAGGPLHRCRHPERALGVAGVPDLADDHRPVDRGEVDRCRHRRGRGQHREEPQCQCLAAPRAQHRQHQPRHGRPLVRWRGVSAQPANSAAMTAVATDR
ncbi:hypothetical protein OHA72_36120 [Dactylosporangium sp. NBC_01737]|nr:hypothetical protein OHA72_36120 [Dactylosporangium sp. NBC_01737]